MLTLPKRTRTRSHRTTPALLESLESRLLLTSINVAMTSGPLPIVTSDTTPSLQGTVDDPNASINIFLGHTNGPLVGQFPAQVQANGTASTWTFTLADANALTDGHYDVLPFATDGSTSSGATGYADSLIIDTTAPQIAFDPNQLPSTHNSVSTLTGTYMEPNIGQIVLTLNNGSTLFHVNATVNPNGTWSAPLAGASLPSGSYSVSATATDLAGLTGTANGAGPLVLDNTPPAVSASTLFTNDATPALSGTVDDPAATVVVTLHGANFPATNNQNGTWSLADNTLPPLADGTYQLVVTATDAAGNHATSNNAFLVVGAAAPIVTVNSLRTPLASPALSGTVNDPAASITVSLQGNSYPATNNGDGTWSLSAGTIAPLATGTYNVSVSATDAFGNVGSDSTSNELSILTSQTITLGTNILKLSYTDADGTLVSVSSGKGSVSLVFSGANITVSGPANAPVLTAAGGIQQVDIHVLANTAGLTFKTNAAGDAFTSINSIDGTGILTSLSAPTAALTHGINMTGYIQSLTLHAIESNITMGAAPKGVSIAANFFLNTTIHTANISTLTAKLAYQASNVVATTIGTVLLANVKTSNNGTPFGLTATTLKSLKITQAGIPLTWKKNFLHSILDFTVTA